MRTWYISKLCNHKYMICKLDFSSWINERVRSTKIRGQRTPEVIGLMLDTQGYLRFLVNSEKYGDRTFSCRTCSLMISEKCRSKINLKCI